VQFQDLTDTEWLAFFFVVFLVRGIFSQASLVLLSLKILAFLLVGFSSYHNSIYESIPDTISFYRIMAWEQYEGDLSEGHT
jgi:hypothetical protein